MSIKSVASVLVVATAFVSLAGCGAPPETDDPEDDATDQTSSALHPRDDLPVPATPQMPSLERPIWDLAPFLEELEQYRRLDDGRCRMRFVRIFDPGRGRPIELPITECF